MKLNDDLHVFALPVPGMPTQNMIFNLSLILDAAHGPTLVDTGAPMQREALLAALAEAGLAVADLKRIIITHQDIDHVGLLHDLAAASGAEVLAHSVEIPTIDGSAQPRFMNPVMQERAPFLRALAEGFRPTPVTTALADGQRLDLAGGVRVIFTPGHTPGHISLYLERSKTLIAADALTASEGRLAGPSPQATMNLPLAHQSVKKLSELEIEAIVSYHGGVVSDHAQEQLRQLAQAEELAAAA
jgi:glyoxylase-like metal-dependent hydrolase (beta-lactamase superfamily II)